MSIPASIYEDNKYSRWYFDIINISKMRNWNKNNTSEYLEKHHIIPKSIIKNNDTVFLTAREHFVCHLLLPKMPKDNKHIQKMKLALHRLIHGEKNIIYCRSSHMYEISKKWHSEAASIRSKEFWSQYTNKQRSDMRSGNKNGRYGKEVSDSTRSKISQANKGRFAKEKHHLFNVGHSEESKKKISESKKGQGIGKKWLNNGTEELWDYQQNMPSGYVLGRITKLPVPKAATGKKWYHNPIEKTEKYFFIAHQPDGFLEGRLKNVNTSQ